MDCDEGKHRTFKILNVVGCMMLLLPNGFDLYWGNASIYVLSFMASRHEPANEFLITISISLHLIILSMVVLVCGWLIQRVGTSTMIILGVILCNASTFFGYFAVQHSMGTLNLTVGAMLGFGSGILYSCALKIVIGRAKGDEGILGALLLVAYSIGGSVNCQIITWCVNPLNENPNVERGSFTVFTNKDIIDRVPSMFLILGCFMLIIHVLGMVMLLVSSQMISGNELFKEGMHNKEQSTISETKYKKTSAASTIDECQKTSKYKTDHNANQETPVSHPTKFRDENMQTRSSRDAETMLASNDSTPSEMLRNPVFYSCWLSLFMAELPYAVASNFYKLFGLQWIPDDHFLAIIGSLNTPTIAVVRLFCGTAVDRAGPRTSLIGLQVLIVVFGAWVFFTPMVSRWLYMFFTLVFIGTGGAMYVAATGTIAQIFGKTHVTTNIGLSVTSVVAANIIVPFVIRFLRKFGWFVLFSGTSGVNILSVCFCLKFLPSWNP